MITTLDGIVAALGGAAQCMVVNKASIATQAAAGFSSLWRATGQPGQGAIPGSAAVIDDTLAGAWSFTNPGSGGSYIGRACFVPGNSGTTLFIYDRLAHMGGLSGTTTTGQTVGVDVSGSTMNMTNRRGLADYSEVEWWLEIYTAIGTTGVTATINYTNAAGSTAPTTTIALGGASPLNQAGRIYQIIGAGGEKIKSIQTITHATTATAGSYGITAMRRIATISLPLANYPTVVDWASLGFPRVYDDSCLFFTMITGTTSTGTLVGDMKLVQG